MKKQKKQSFSKRLVDEIKKDKSTFALYVVLRLLVIGAMVLSVVRGKYENLFVCSLALVLFLVPSFFKKNFGIEVPSTLEKIIMLFIFASQILGEIACYYVKFPGWDTMLHTVNGFLCAAIGFSLVDILNQNNRFKFRLSPLYVAIVAFCFSMTIGVLWEMFEYSADCFFKTDMQKDFVVYHISSVALDNTMSNKPVIIDGITEVYVNGTPLGLGGYLDIGLHDTMKDLMVNFVGAVVFSIIGFFYIKSRGRNKFAERFIPKVKEYKQFERPENDFEINVGDNDFEDNGKENDDDE